MANTSNTIAATTSTCNTPNCAYLLVNTEAATLICEMCQQHAIKKGSN
jgi:hypothetical protein